MTPDDQPFLRRVYQGTRAEEMAVVPWSDEEKRAFLDMQFAAQQEDYTTRFPDSDHAVVLVDAEPVGRLWVSRWKEEIRLLDIALLPERRNQGTGSVLLGRLQEEAAAAGVPLRHSVYKANHAALRFYERLGFTVVDDFGTHLLMEWQPSG